MKSVDHCGGLFSGLQKNSTGFHRLTVCLLSDQECGIPTEFIQEIIPPPPKLQVNTSPPPPLAGIVDLRGLQLPTVYLYQLLGFPCTLNTVTQRTVVCRLLGCRIGFLVDAIGESLSIPNEFIQPAQWHTPFVSHVARLDQEVRSVPILELGVLMTHLQHLLVNQPPQWQI